MYVFNATEAAAVVLVDIDATGVTEGEGDAGG
jgi:hypothetical protein